MKNILSFCFALAVFISITETVHARPEVAFGYMQNAGNDSESNYLETILPNSCANSINAIFDLRIKKPVNLEKELRAQGSALKKEYELFELPELLRTIGADMFVYGYFVTLPENSIKIVMNIYMKGYNEIFKFTYTGRMATQITNLVDSISVVIINFMNEHTQYKVKSILPGTKLAVLTNLNNAEQNIMLTALMERGFFVSCFQNNSLYNIINDRDIEKFKFMTTGKNSYEEISDIRKTAFLHGAWSGEENIESINTMRATYRKYDPDYSLVKDMTLDRIYRSFDSNIDVLLVIGFSRDRKTSWARAINLRDKELIWMYSNVKADYFALNPVLNNTKKIIDAMTAEPVNPFKKLNKTSK